MSIHKKNHTTQPIRLATYNDFIAWELSAQTIDFKTIYCDMSQDLIAGLMLSEVAFWWLPTREGREKGGIYDGHGRKWIRRKRTYWWGKCRISPKQADRGAELLKERGLIETRLERLEGDPAPYVYFTLNIDRFLELLNEQILKLTQRADRHFDDMPEAECTYHARPKKDPEIDLDLKSKTDPTSPKSQSQLRLKVEDNLDLKSKSLYRDLDRDLSQRSSINYSPSKEGGTRVEKQLPKVTKTVLKVRAEKFFHDRFWPGWVKGKKLKKDEALKAMLGLVDKNLWSEGIEDRIMVALALYIKHVWDPAWCKKQHIPYPASWLNSKAFNDDPADIMAAGIEQQERGGYRNKKQTTHSAILAFAQQEPEFKTINITGEEV